MNDTHLPGLEGTNPLGFLAALGVQAAFVSEAAQPRLWWSEDVVPHAVVDGDFTIDRIVDRALGAFAAWANSPAMHPRRSDDSPIPKGDELKLSLADVRTYLRRAARASRSGSALAFALVAEASLDNQGVAKPSDLYFTAGKQKFLAMARQILSGASRAAVSVGLEGPWPYDSKLPSLMWDVSDDRVYALTADDPSTDKKLTNSGPEALAILGLSLHPVFASRNRTLTQGCSGSWKEGRYTWPLWNRPARLPSVQSLLAHASHHDPAARARHRWFRSWGVSRVLCSRIRRSSQGGYGTFGPPGLVWQASTAPSAR